MMTITCLTPALSVAPQIAPEEMAAIRAEGFAAILCNRPDGEDPDQPSFAEVAAAARAVGLRALHVPVDQNGVTAENLLDFAEALHELPEPVLAYCRTGRRSATLWSHLEVARLSREAVR